MAQIATSTRSDLDNRVPPVTSHSHTESRAKYHYPLQYVGQPRPIRVIVIGAGVSGIAAVKLFKDTFKDDPVTMTIYEKNADVTGTWLENRYPG